MLPMTGGEDSITRGTGKRAGLGPLSFRRIIDIPFDTCVVALESWQRAGHNFNLQSGHSRLRGPIQHDHGSGTC